MQLKGVEKLIKRGLLEEDEKNSRLTIPKKHEEMNCEKEDEIKIDETENEDRTKE